MQNPYMLLGIRQSATSNEIREALKKQINLYCRHDESMKNADGEYLKEMFSKAAKSLLDPEKRKQIDADIAKNNKDHGLVPYEEKDNSKSENNSSSMINNGKNTNVAVKNANSSIVSSDEKNTVVTSSKQAIENKEPITNLVIPNVKRMLLNYDFQVKNNYSDDNKILINSCYVVIGRDCSCLIVNEDGRRSFLWGYSLVDAFSGQTYYREEEWKDFLSWRNGEIMTISGVESKAYPIMKFLPFNMVEDHKASLGDLKRVAVAVEQVLLENPQIADNIFSSYQKVK